MASFDVIVIGGGLAGCEAVPAGACMKPLELGVLDRSARRAA